MHDVHIELGSRSYDIRIGPGLLNRPEEFLPWIAGQQLFVITNEVVAINKLITLVVQTTFLI